MGTRRGSKSSQIVATAKMSPGLSVGEIAERCGVAKSLTSRIVRRYVWSSVHMHVPHHLMDWLRDEAVRNKISVKELVNAILTDAYCDAAGRASNPGPALATSRRVRVLRADSGNP